MDFVLFPMAGGRSMIRVSLAFCKPAHYFTSPFFNNFIVIAPVRVTCTILCLLLAPVVFGQGNAGNYNSDDPASLALRLTTGLRSDKDKVKAIFYWITDNIAYSRPLAPRNLRKDHPPIMTAEDDNDTLALPALTERVAAKVIRDRRGVCEGYARLFKSLCDHASLQSEIVTGYVRDNTGRSNRFSSNHTWNAVYFDSAWHLLDATWASGYVTYPSGEFVRSFNGYYFLTPPADFITHHYPDDLKWTLLSDPPAVTEFRTTPFRQRSFNKYYISNYYPARGIIEASVGDTLHFQLEMDGVWRNGSIAPDSLWDSATLVYSPRFAYLHPENTTPDGKATYSLPIESTELQWLYVMFNNDAVLRYRVNIRRPVLSYSGK